MGDFLQRLRQRKLVQWSLAYLAGAWVLLQVLGLAAESFGWPALAMRIAFGIITLGFVITLVLAWYHGERGVQKVGGTELLLLALMLVVGGALLWKYAGDAQAPQAAATTAGSRSAVATAPGAAVANDKSIAVLPFDSLSADPSDAYFADGLSVETINALSRVPDLRVAARTSSFAYRDNDRTVPQIAGELRVATVLEGSVRRAGERLRISVQLVRAADGFELWSQTYDRSSQDVIAIQEDVATSIAETLKTSLDPAALAAMQRAGTQSVPAYLDYLRGLALQVNADPDGNPIDANHDALAAFDRATALDPGFVDAHAHSADLQWDMLRLTSLGAPAMDRHYPARLDRLRSELEQTARLARTAAEGNYYAALRASLDLRFIDASRLMAAYARTYAQDNRAYDYLATWALYAGDERKARAWIDADIAVLRRGAGAENASLSEVVAMLIWAGDYQAAANLARRQLRMFPDNMFLKYNAHRALLAIGDTAAAATLVPDIESSGWQRYSKLLVQIRQACAEGRTAVAARLLDAADREGKLDPVVRWHALVLLRREDEAARRLRHLDQPATLHAFSSWLVYPQFDVTRFPNLQAVLEAQGIHRPPARLPPFACKPEAADR
jgi:TolB-like protein